MCWPCLFCYSNLLPVARGLIWGFMLSGNLISLPMYNGSCPSVQPQLLGDIAIPLGTAQRQADRRALSLHKETAALFVHGMLHRMGYDHEQSPADNRRMKAKEREVLSSLSQNC